MYGYLLSNEGVLQAVETSWVLLAGLVPQDVSFVCFLGLERGGEGRGQGKKGQFANAGASDR